MTSTTPKMKIPKNLARQIWLILILSLVASPLSAQTHRPPTPQKAAAKPVTTEVAPTFDTLLAADSYRIYAEVRGVGQLIRSQGVNDLLDPVMKLASPPREFKTLVRWLGERADQLTTSRMLVAAWPSKDKLPQFVCAIEFGSPEEAQKFEPQLRDFLPKIIPSPSPTPAGSASPGAKVNPQPKKPDAPAPAPYVIKHAGSLVLISQTSVAFKALRPTGSKLLSEDQTFRQVRDRFATEPAFLYLNIKTIVAEDEERRRKAQQQYEEELKKRQAEAAANPAATPTPDEVVSDHFAITTISKDPSAQAAASPDVVDAKAAGNNEATLTQTEPAPISAFAVNAFFGNFLMGQPKWPDALGLGLSFDADSYNARLLLLSESQAKVSPIPFLPQLISGPAINPAAASVLPADTEMLITASLDLPTIYDGLIKSYADSMEQLNRAMRQTAHSSGEETVTAESPFAAYEKMLGIKMKEDLLPMLGNEIATTIPLKAWATRATPSPSPDAGDNSSLKQDEKKPQPAQVFAIAIRDKEGIRALIPKAIEAMGLKGASMLAQTERRGDTELITYANVAGYAFIGDFLIFSTSVDATRHVVDSYLEHQTLASDSRYRNSTRWQPRQVLGQVYVAEGLLETVSDNTPGMMNEMGEKLRDIMLRLSPTNDPVTYALYNEGFGPIHEVRVPKNLVIMLTAGLAAGREEAPLAMNEARAQGFLRTIFSAEATYAATKGVGNFGSMEQLIAENMIPDEYMKQSGYNFQLTAAGNRFEVTAVPKEYGKSGRMSFFIDESGVLRGADHRGEPATVVDKPLQ